MFKLILSLVVLICPLMAEVIAHTKIGHQLLRLAEDEMVLAITLAPQEHWHTYWENPGDAGMALDVEVEGIQVEPQPFPTPKRYELAGLVAYGYEDEQSFLFTLKGDLSAPLTVQASWLACNDEKCVPGDKEFQINAPEVTPLFTPEGELAAPQWFADAMDQVKTDEEVIQHRQTELTDGVAHLSFKGGVDLTDYTVFPYNENFSEIDGETKITLQPDGRFSFSMQHIGELGEPSSFLFTNGDKTFRVRL